MNEDSITAATRIYERCEVFEASCEMHDDDDDEFGGVHNMCPSVDDDVFNCAWCLKHGALPVE
jgi:hypothetical protein